MRWLSAHEAGVSVNQKIRSIIRKEFEQVFQACDALIGPTTPTTAFKLGEKINDSMSMYLSDVYTVSSPLAGVPSILIPIGNDSKDLPIGFQITRKAFEEGNLLRIAHWVEETVLKGL